MHAHRNVHTLTHMQRTDELQQCLGESGKKMMLHVKQTSQTNFQLN